MHCCLAGLGDRAEASSSVSTDTSVSEAFCSVLNCELSARVRVAEGAMQAVIVAVGFAVACRCE